MRASVRLRFVAIYFRRPPEVPRRQVKPWSQKIEPSTWLDPPIQTYNDVSSNREGGNHNMAEVGRFFRIEAMCCEAPGSAGLAYCSSLACSASSSQGLSRCWAPTLGALGLRVRRGDLQTARIGK
jgi:hypothetical protein